MTLDKDNTGSNNDLECLIVAIKDLGKAFNEEDDNAVKYIHKTYVQRYAKRVENQLLEQPTPDTGKGIGVTHNVLTGTYSIGISCNEATDVITLSKEAANLLVDYILLQNVKDTK